MTPPADLVATYLQLARVSVLRGRPYVRDKLLLLAAAIAASSDLPMTAKICRERILRHNPQHWIGRYSTAEEAMADDDFVGLVRQAQRRYSPERAEQMLESLGIPLTAAREKYFTSRAMISSLLGVDVGEVDDV
jgi:hypothetical protein